MTMFCNQTATNIQYINKHRFDTLYFEIANWQFLKILDRFGGFFVEYEICASLRNSDITQYTTHPHSFNNVDINL